MTPEPTILEELRAIDPGLRVVWEPIIPDENGKATVSPPITADGGSLTRKASDLPPARWVIYAQGIVSRRPYKVMDVLDMQGQYMPLDRRVLDLLARRDDAWDRLDEESERVAKARLEAATQPETKDDYKAEGLLDDALGQYYRDATGQRPMAMGAPGKPAAPRIGQGFTVNDKRRFAHLLEA